MKPRVFYMQASLFTKYIWERNPKYFLQFVKKLEAKGFLISFSETYNADVYQIWKEFVNSLSEYNNHFHPASERRAGEVKRYEY